MQGNSQLTVVYVVSIARDFAPFVVTCKFHPLSFGLIGFCESSSGMKLLCECTFTDFRNLCISPKSLWVLFYVWYECVYVLKFIKCVFSADNWIE